MALVFITGVTNDSDFGYFFIYFENLGPHRLRKQAAFPLIFEKRYCKINFDYWFFFSFNSFYVDILLFNHKHTFGNLHIIFIH